MDYVLASAREDDPLLKEEQGRQALGALGMSGAMALRLIGSLSGGEKARVALASFVLRPRNVLLLDEPSNHLDVGAVKALTDGLQGWDGALLAVSHNKEFCESLNPTHIVRVKGGEMTMENCYGLTAADFDHDDSVAGDATAAAVAAAAAAGGVGGEKKGKEEEEDAVIVQSAGGEEDAQPEIEVVGVEGSFDDADTVVVGVSR